MNAYIWLKRSVKLNMMASPYYLPNSRLSAEVATVKFILLPSEFLSIYILDTLLKVHRWCHIIHSFVHLISSFFIRGICWNSFHVGMHRPAPPLELQNIPLYEWLWLLICSLDTHLGSFLLFANTVPHETLGQVSLLQVCINGLLYFPLNYKRSWFPVILNWAMESWGFGL